MPKSIDYYAYRQIDVHRVHRYVSHPFYHSAQIYIYIGATLFLILLGAVAETFKKQDFLSNFLGETVVLLTWRVVRGCAGLRGQYS